MENMSSDAIGSWDALKATDPDVYAAIEAEEVRQREKLLSDRVGKLCQSRGPGRSGLRDDQ